MKVITRKYKLEKWKAIITNQMASGLTAAEYCRQEDLPISTFFYWKRTIRQELIAQMDKQVSKPAIVEVPLFVSETPLEEAPPALKEAGRKNTSKSYMWVFMGGEFTAKNSIRIYQYQETRKGANAQTFLSGFSGALLSDGYQGYNSVDNVKRFGCWSHARRKFVGFTSAEKGWSCRYHCRSMRPQDK